MDGSRRPPRSTLVAGAALALALGTAAPAGELAAVLAAETGKIELAQASQKRIDQVVSETQDLESEYKRIHKEIDGLEIYNGYLERQVADQVAELDRLRVAMEQVASMERQIVPLMIRMLDGLEAFVELDLPFLLEERRGRVAALRAMMDRADVTAAEKFRRIAEAFQIENDFGRTIETYKDTLTIGEARLEVTVLRLGRIGLYYQTNDASVSGTWDPAAREWKPLGDARSRNQIRQGIRIAEKQIAPDLLLLPVPAPEARS